MLALYLMCEKIGVLVDENNLESLRTPIKRHIQRLLFFMNRIPIDENEPLDDVKAKIEFIVSTIYMHLFDDIQETPEQSESFWLTWTTTNTFPFWSFNRSHAESNDERRTL